MFLGTCSGLKDARGEFWGTRRVSSGYLQRILEMPAAFSGYPQRVLGLHTACFVGNRSESVSSFVGARSRFWDTAAGLSRGSKLAGL